MNDFNKHAFFMRKALKLAEQAFGDDEVPVGCVIAHKDKVIAQAHNQVERLKDSTAHAELIAVTQAEGFLKSKWLNGCSVYVTIEPCLMCASALVLSRVKEVHFGIFEPKFGGMGSVADVNKLGLNHRFRVSSGILAEESRFLIQSFFQNKRYPKAEGGRIS